MSATGQRPGQVRGAIVAVFLTLIRAYQLLVSPLLGPRCRYLPTCSEYARDAIIAHGLVRGGVLAVRRLLRCHPLGGSGVDPVPDPAPTNGAANAPDSGLHP